MEENKKIAIIGAGFIGLEAAEAAWHLPGISVLR